LNSQNLKFTHFKSNWSVKTGLTGRSEFKLISLNRQSSSQNICNELLKIFRDGYTQYLKSNRAHHKI
jgi:hypothetical protein